MFSALKLFLNLRFIILTFIIWLMAGFTFADAEPECAAQDVICPVDRVWTEQELTNHITLPQPKRYSFFVDESGLTLVFHRSISSADPMRIFWFTGQSRMARVEETNYWTATLWFEGIDTSIASFGVADDAAQSYGTATYWGINAPRPPAINDPLVGHIETIAFKSAALNQTRVINVYLPPDHDPANTYPTIYMADGESLVGYAGSLDYLITEGIVPSLIVVGIASATSPDGRNLRGEEYVIGRNPDLFERHARFFADEVRVWAEAHLGASKERDQRGIFGISNGGLFAVVMTVQHPELYGFAFTFSVGASAGYKETFTVDETTVELPFSVYGTAGTLEPIFLETTTRYIDAYQNAGAKTAFSGNVAGHDGTIWEIEFVKAVRWMFESQ